jgi:glycosyltransferase involved in cell wall biosynthesis
MALKISIALCVFNGESYLGEQLESIRNQTKRPYELVVCDDGSQDQTIRIIQEFAESVEFPVHLHRNEINLGSTKNFEKAIGLCRGDLIALCDQDDSWMAGKLEAIGAIFDSDGEVAAVFSNAILVDLNGAPIGENLWSRAGFGPARQKSFYGGAAVKQLIERDTVTGATAAFRSCFRDRLIPIEPNWVHDGWIALILACLAKVQPISDSLIRYRLHPRQQIGADKLSLADRLLTNKERAITFHRKTSERWAVMARKLESLSVDRNVVTFLTQKAAFFGRRAELLKKARWRRISPGTSMLTGYFKFDKGLLSYLRDLTR